MIVNASNMVHVIVELTREELCRLATGEDLWQQVHALVDAPVLVRVYCSNPGRIAYDLQKEREKEREWEE